MKQKRKDLDSILKKLDSIKNSTNPHKKVDDIITRRGLTKDYFIDIENTLIADSYTAVDNSTYSKGSINKLAITHEGAKFITKGGYILEHRKDYAIKTDLFFKILTAIFTLLTIGLSVLTKQLDDKHTTVQKELTNQIDSLFIENIYLQEQLVDIKKQLPKP